MKKIYEPLPLELWMEIAKKVRRLNFTNERGKEFYVNLQKIVKLLSTMDFDLTTGLRQAIKKEEIGLTMLVNMIYEIELENKGIAFYEKIFELDKLGIKTIEFLPVEFYDSARMEQHIIDNKTISLSKVFTDGEFDFCRYGKKTENIKIGNLTNANYILKFDMRRDENDKLIIIDGCASLKNFNGNFPTLKEVRKDTYPEIDEAPPRYFFDKEPHLSKQIFDVTNSDCVKKM